MSRTIQYALLAVLLALTFSTAHATEVYEIFAEGKMVPSEGQANALFGFSVSADGEFAIVGAPRDNAQGYRAGAAYIFRWDGHQWIESQKLLPSDGSPNDAFGYSVALSGDRAIVGAPQDDDDQGAAYIFYWNGSQWTQQQKLLASDGVADDAFGYSVAISDDKAIVGAPEDRDNGPIYGSAYLFHRDASQWSERQKLRGDSGAIAFGRAVAISGNLSVVGDPSEYVGDWYFDAWGSVSCFGLEGGQWHRQQKLKASDLVVSHFGRAVALSGNTAHVGASGKVYLFRRQDSRWNEMQILRPSDESEGDAFGDSVAISGDVAVVGAPDDDVVGSPYVSFGSVYVFRHDGSQWTERQKLVAFDRGDSDDFGRSVALSGEVLLVGAPQADVLDADSGAVYAADLSESFASDCNDNDIPDDDELADGAAFDCDSDGLIDRCQDPCLTEAPCPHADVNCDGLVDGQDIAVIRQGTNWFRDVCDVLEQRADVNDDGMVDGFDIATVRSDHCWFRAAIGFAKFVETGGPLPGGTETIYRLDDPPSMRGVQLAFAASTIGRRGIYSTAGGFHTVADTSTVVPGTGRTFMMFGDFSFDGQSTAFIGSGWDDDVYVYGVYTEVDGTLHTVADYATEVPGGEGPIRALPGLSMGAGILAFQAVTSSKHRGIYTDVGGHSDGHYGHGHHYSWGSGFVHTRALRQPRLSGAYGQLR